MSEHTITDCLARYMDLKAFAARKVGKEQAERLKARREIAVKRAKAAVRFFEKPENFARLQHRIEAKALGRTPNEIGEEG